MKGLIIELMLIAIGAVAVAFLRYKITSSPLLILDALPINVLIVNVIGSFILGIFSVLAMCKMLYNTTKDLQTQRKDN